MITFDEYLDKFGIKDKKEFFNPTGKYLDDCYKYKNMRDAVQMAKYHMLANDPLYILSDSGDCDGITSACICYDYIHSIHPKLDIKILIHENKERGLQDDKLFKQITTEVRPWVIIPDAGTNDVDRARELSELSVDLIGLDHHALDTPIETGILVNNQVGEVSHCGSGCLVTHKFLQALDREFDIKNSTKYIDMVALSLVSDVMDMSDLQNRTYYKFGIETYDCINNPFLKALFDKFIGDKPYTQRDIAFKIVPKLNAVSRSGKQDLKQQVFAAFLGLIDNLTEVADACGKQHSEQTRIVAKAVEENKPNINYDDKLIILASDNIPKTYAGLIAAKLSENHPIIVGSVKDGEMIGSFRSPVDIDDTLEHNPLISWKRGHSQASGIALPSENIQPLIDFYNSLESLPQPYTDVLGSWTTKSMSKRLFDEFDTDTDELRGMYGKGFPKPLIHLHDIIVKPNDVQVMGKTGRTLKLNKDGIDIIWFFISNADKELLLSDKTYKLEIIGTMGINEWNGVRTPQLIVEQFETSPYELTLDNFF